jgi:hypothetical protein
MRSSHAALLFCLSGCATPGPYADRGERVELLDTLPALSAALRSSEPRVPDGPTFAWLAYEKEHAAMFEAAGAQPEDPGDQVLRKLSVSPGAVVALLEGFDAAAPGELRALVGQLTAKLSGTPRMAFAFCALRSSRQLFSGSLEGQALVVVNARAPELSSTEARQVLLARALFEALHRERQPDSASLGPVARRLYREGAALLAVRQLVPGAREDQVLGLDPATLARLRTREALAAKELLASLDTSRPSETARFFDPKVKDPLLPPGAGLYLADRLFQRLAAEQGSMTRPLNLPPADFLTAARKQLAIMAGAR